MKVLFVTPRYYPHVGGVEYVVKSVAERFAKRGHDVTVLCGNSKLAEPVEEDVNGVRVVRWPTWSPSEAYHIPRMRGRFAEKVKELARDQDVVHFHSVHSVLTMYALNVLKECPVRKVLTAHYHGTGHTLFRRFAWIPWRLYIKNLLKHVDVVHAVSKYEGELLRRDFSVEYVIVEHGVEEWLKQVEWKPSGYVMYSGRIEKYKNVHRLANIVKYLNEMGFDLELKVFGEGSFKKDLEKHLKKLRLKHELYPPQPYEKYIEYLSRAPLFGSISEKEAFGQAVNEANAIGTPVVVSEPWGFNFAGRSRTLVVNPKRDDKEIAREVAEFLERAREQPKPIVPSWSEVVDLYVKLLYNKTQCSG